MEYEGLGERADKVLSPPTEELFDEWITARARTLESSPEAVSRVAYYNLLRTDWPLTIYKVYREAYRRLVKDAPDTPPTWFAIFLVIEEYDRPLRRGSGVGPPRPVARDAAAD